MNILIAGGAGCLGSNLIEHWVPLGHDICVVDNFVTGHRELVHGIEGVQTHEFSIANGDKLDSLVQSFKPDVIINSAASYADPNDWNADVTTNVIGSINLAKTALKHDVNRLINFQTALCYGRPQTLPIDETHALSPFTSYGISKTAGEQFLLNSGINNVSLRLANITGPRLSIGPIPTFYKRLKEGKACFCTTSRRDFLDIDDFLRLMDCLLENNEISGVYNVSSGVSTSIHDIYQLVCEYLEVENKSVEIKKVSDDDVEEVCLNPKKLFADTGWQSIVDLPAMIKKQLQWYDQHGVGAIHSHLKG
ncbi:NAD-dependent epimerase/dehydratase family protein [Paracoccaceae bacterium]|nr:NAD-dependent epimerase/dehydratase family protein [Paracoccaceae bacterium]